MGFKSFDFRCGSCDHVQPELLDREEDPEQVIVSCEECGGASTRTMSLPNITRASYVDGTDRFAALKKKSKMKLASYDLPYKERAEINKEIKKVERMDKNKG